jgi:hypothetical protein
MGRGRGWRLLEAVGPQPPKALSVRCPTCVRREQLWLARHGVGLPQVLDLDLFLEQVHLVQEQDDGSVLKPPGHEERKRNLWRHGQPTPTPSPPHTSRWPNPHGGILQSAGTGDRVTVAPGPMHGLRDAGGQGGGNTPLLAHTHMRIHTHARAPAVANLVEQVQCLHEPVLGRVLVQHLVVLADSRHKNHCSYIVKAMDPLAALVALPSYIVDPGRQ